MGRLRKLLAAALGFDRDDLLSEVGSLEKLIVLCYVERLLINGASAQVVERERPNAEAVAASVVGALRDAHRALKDRR